MNITASVSNNSILRVVIAPNAPDAFDNCVEFPTFRPSLRCPFPGWCLEVLLQLTEYLNITVDPIIYYPKDGQVNWGVLENDQWNGVLGLVENGTADTVCMFYQQTELRQQTFDFTYPITAVSPMYIVQRTDTALSSGLWNAFSPYQNTAWMAYLAMFSAQLLFMIFLTRVECSLGQRPCSTFETFWKLIRLQLYQPLNVTYFTMAGNCMVLIFSMFQCRLFLDMYQNLLLSSLLRPVQSSVFKSAEDIIEQIQQNKYSFVTNYAGHWYFEEFNRTNTIGLLSNITTKIRITKSISQTLDLVSTGRYIYPTQQDSAGAFEAKSRCDLTYVSEGKKTEKLEKTWKTAHLIFRKQSKWIDPFNRAIIQNMDFIRRTSVKYFDTNEFIPVKKKQKRRKCKEHEVQNEKRKPLSMISIFGILVIAAGGIIISTATFGFELYVCWQNRMLQYKDRVREAWLNAVANMTITKAAQTNIG